MNTYIITGTTKVDVFLKIESESQEEALKVAEDTSCYDWKFVNETPQDYIDINYDYVDIE
jgi:hypothetical protein